MVYNTDNTVSPPSKFESSRQENIDRSDKKTEAIESFSKCCHPTLEKVFLYPNYLVYSPYSAICDLISQKKQDVQKEENNLCSHCFPLAFHILCTLSCLGAYFGSSLFFQSFTSPNTFIGCCASAAGCGSISSLGSSALRRHCRQSSKEDNIQTDLSNMEFDNLQSHPNAQYNSSSMNR